MKKWLLKYAKNKYILAIIAFIVVLVIVDDNSLVMSLQLKNQLKQLEDKKGYYLQEIANDSTNTIELKTNIKKIEQYGREEYNMKRKNEDIFIIHKGE